MNKYFYKEMEKCAVLGAIMAGAQGLSTIAEIKENKKKLTLAAPGEPQTNQSQYAHQFKSTNIQTPNRSLFG